MPIELLPIKVVFPSDDDFRTPGNAPREWDPLCEVTSSLRQEFTSQVRIVSSAFQATFRRWPDMPGVARVTLREEAQAKSYRPSELFNERTCPIIGGGTAGELFISASSAGLQRVESIIGSTAKRTTAHISTLESIKPYHAETRPGLEVRRKRLESLRVRLFNHQSDAANQAVEQAFVELITESGAEAPTPLDYADGLRIYRVDSLPEAALPKLHGFVGVQSVSPFPLYQPVQTQGRIVSNISATHFPPPDTSKSYGLVGLIDTGTDAANPFLQAWVAHRYERWVPPDRQNTTHGSFVAGLIANGRMFNHNDPRLPAAAARIVDVVAFDKDMDLREDELLVIIDDALAQFPHVKVWNFSLGTKANACEDLGISELGAALDERARKYGVLFIVASGNYRLQPYRPWPPVHALDDRVRPPADTVRGIVVGGIAHLDTPNTVVRREEPAPFTRRGPGSCGLTKPDVSHYAGNCDGHGQYNQSGLISVDGDRHLTEDVGTSFACPFVSAITANVYQELDTQSGASPVLTKALLAHATFVRNGPPSIADVHYRGIGIPPDVDGVLNCTQSVATIIMQVGVRNRPIFEKRPFPMPPCLAKEKGLQCDIFMTLLYDCPLDANYQLEYCRNNVRASLGTLSQANNGEEKYGREVHPVPESVNEHYTSELYESGHLWSPLKLYYRRFTRGPVRPWRLTLSATNRAENTSRDPQDVVLLVTIRSFDRNDLVYDELVREMSRFGWATADLQNRSRARERGR